MKKIFISIFLWYIITFAKLQLKKINPIIIGVGGASGKSSLVHISEQLLGDKFKVKQSKGKNSETGIPLNILDIEIEKYDLYSWIKIALIAPIKLITNWDKYDIYIVEMGIDSPEPPKNMSYLLEFIKPNISILTNIYLEHSEYFDSLVDSEKSQDRKIELIEKIADQEKLLITKIPKTGRVIVNLDDEYIKKSLPVKAKTLTVSAKNKDADFYISFVDIKENLFELDFSFLGEKYTLKLNKPLPEYFKYTFVFALALAFSNEISIPKSIKKLEDEFSLPAGRFSVFKGIENSTIIDSSYNSSLEPAIGALKVLGKIGEGKRKVGIIGDMRELGSVSKIQHEILAKEMIKNLDFAVIIGEQMRKYVSPVLGNAGFKFEAFDSFKEAKLFIKDMVKKNDLILVKASQNTLFLERAVEMLLADKSDAKNLTRRGEYWNKIRNKTP